MNALRLFLALLVALGARAAAADPAASAANLLPDGDFEHIDHGPQDWVGFGPGAEVVEDPELVIGQTTGHALRLQAGAGAGAAAPVLRATVVAHPMSRLVLRMRLRTADLHPTGDAPAVALTLSGSGMGGKVQLAQLIAGPGCPDLPWTPLAAYVDVPPGIIVLSVAATMNATGTAWIGDVELIPDPPLPGQVVGADIPQWNFTDAAAVAVVTDPDTKASWLHLHSDRRATAVMWGAMAADWKRIAVSLRLRGDGLVLGAAARTTASAPAGTPPPVVAGVLATWVDDHDRPLGATFDDLMMPSEGDWTAMQLHLDIPRPGALLRLTALLDGGGSLDIDSVQILPIQAGQ